MYYPNEKEFIKLAKCGNIVPVYKEIFADTETPVSSYLKLNTDDYSYLLESVEGEEKIARFSFLGSNPSIIFKSKGNKISVTSFKPDFSSRNKGRVTKNFITKLSPLAELTKIIEKLKFVDIAELPRFSGGFVGYLGYDMVRFFEPRLSRNRLIDDLKLADMYFILAQDLIIFDHTKHCLKIIVNAHIKPELKHKTVILQKKYKEIIRRIEDLQNKLKGPIPSYKLFPKISVADNKRQKIKVKSNVSKQAFRKMVLRAKEYIRSGEIIQVVLSQRFSSRISNSPFDIYRSLRSINPSPYMYYLNFKGVHFLGSSPEMFVRCEKTKVQMRPIAGTRKRGKDEREDLELAKNLLSDKKEKAEHLMLVDLGRNDLGRVCKYGTVKVDEFMGVEKYSHVMHIVSNVRGELDKKKNIFDVITSTFPAGTVTGAPKVRAMEIIDELEKVSRGPYAGCVGYFSLSGNLDTCITIRTILVKKDIAYIQAGAGIVADSDPGKEYSETVNKAKAQIEAIMSVSRIP